MRYVIIGASAAGINAAKTLRETDSECEIVLISKDENVYSRCMLHLYISGERNLDSLSFIENDFFDKNKITWLKGLSVMQINDTLKTLELSNNKTLSYDKLLIASGASAFIPPVKNLREATNVFPLRNIEDAISIAKRYKYGDNVVIIGGGLVGIDAAIGLIHKSANIHLVEMADRILPLQLDKTASSKYENLLLKNNVKLYLNSSAKEVILNEKGEAATLALSDGTEISCDLVIVAAGVRPNIDFIKDTQIKTDRGILIDNTCKTNIDDIFSAGDVTALSPIWPVAARQGKCAALNMLGKETTCDDTFAYLNSMNFLGLESVSIGTIEAPDNTYSTEIYETKNIYKKIIHKNGIIYGALLQGDISYCGVLCNLIKNKINISHLNKSIFKINSADF
ncbi:NAD(P)/FAD-dependent oxidoreductase [Clostridium sp. 'White wine YQ']|uniref:NAD(P)/FAD-dependent oxidoreductase n=1 Tax=Clostridium sp. 'White wine YQ' TaxID=3027474 RepID=UPI0023662149|nr:FAD-dependent oxidoreductase [Clostridium sp. 'White wine YQ']MDD7794232.1 FAD-dependent oxidoreductase [Clostridium sp. 'White wine YQ']